MNPDLCTLIKPYAYYQNMKGIEPFMIQNTLTIFRSYVAEEDSRELCQLRVKGEGSFLLVSHLQSKYSDQIKLLTIKYKYTQSISA